MERRLLLIKNRKSVIAFQHPGIYFARDATWRKKRRFVTSGLPKNDAKSPINQKRYEMEQKLLLITNRKSVIAFQNPGLYFAWDATWRKNRRFVTSDLPKNDAKSPINQKRY